MREALTGAEMTKDVRTSAGWRVGFNLYETVQIFHQRREQSVDLWDSSSSTASAAAAAANHFELDYELRMTFDRGMTQMHAAHLRVLQLQTADTMEPNRRTELQSKLMGDLIVL